MLLSCQSNDYQGEFYIPNGQDICEFNFNYFSVSDINPFLAFTDDHPFWKFKGSTDFFSWDKDLEFTIFSSINKYSDEGMEDFDTVLICFSHLPIEKGITELKLENGNYRSILIEINKMPFVFLEASSGKLVFQKEGDSLKIEVNQVFGTLVDFIY